jgi:hypothetical protein
MSINLHPDYDRSYPSYWPEDDCDNRLRCEGCDRVLTEDDAEDFGDHCEDCHDAAQREAEKAIRDGADERSYTEDEAA